MCCAVLITAVMAYSLWPYGMQPARLLCPWDSPGKNAEVHCPALLQGIFLAQGSSPHLLCLLHWQVGSWPLAPSGRLPHCWYHKHKMSVCPITVDVNLDHQVKVVSARFLHCNVTIFPLIISKCPVVKYFETMWISCFSSIINSVKVFVSSLKQLLLLWLPNGDSLIPSLLLHFTSWNSLKKSFPFYRVFSFL